MEPSIGDGGHCYVGTVVIFRAAYRRTPVLLKGVFAFRRKLSPGLKVQVMFQTRTCTFALAVENYSPGAQQMLYLGATVENGTGRR